LISTIRIILWVQIIIGIPFLIVAPSLLFIQLLLTTFTKYSFTNDGFLSLVSISIIICTAYVFIFDMRNFRVDKNITTNIKQGWVATIDNP
jgi:hypothetical protein